MFHPGATDRRRGQRWRWGAVAATGLVIAGFLVSSPSAWASTDAALSAAPAPAAAAPAGTALAVKASATAIHQGTPVTLTYALTASAKPVAGAKVTLTYAGTTTHATLNSTGKGSVVLRSLPAGRQSLKVSYAGDALHAASSGAATVTVASLSTVVLTTPKSTLPPGTLAPVTITLTSGGKPVAGAVAAVTFPGRTITSPRTSSTGKATVNLPLPNGRNAVIVRYAGDALHAPAAASLAVTMHAASTITVTASDTTPAAGVGVTIGWKLTAAGKPVVAAPVKVNVRTSSIKATGRSDGSGTVKLSGLAAGPAKVTVVYAGDAGHGAVSGSVLLSVIGRTSITASLDRTTTTPDKAVTVTFRVASGTKPIQGHVLVRYGAVSRTVYLNADGRGSLAIAGGTFATGAHPITVSWAGSTWYTGSSKTVTVTMVKNTACPAWASACVDLTNNTTWLQSGGRITYGPVPMSSGRPGFRTPAGAFVVYWKDKDHVSSIYDASMPNAIFFNGGVAFHEGSVYVESHGCIHLTWSASQKYWDTLHYGDMVVVFGYAQY